MSRMTLEGVQDVSSSDSNFTQGWLDQDQMQEQRFSDGSFGEKTEVYEKGISRWSDGMMNDVVERDTNESQGVDYDIVIIDSHKDGD